MINIMPMPQLTEDAIISMREKLVNAGLKLYRSKGLAAIKMRAIAAELGVSHTQPYSYFENKDALISGMRMHCFAKLGAEVVYNIDDRLPTVDRLAGLVNAYISFAQNNPDEYRLMFMIDHYSSTAPDDLVDVRNRVFDEACAVVEEYCQKYDVGLDGRTATHIGWSSVHGLICLELGDQLAQGHQFEELVPPLMATVFGQQLGSRIRQSESRLEFS